MDSLVSVIIPVYNSEHYISETLDSLLQSTYKNFEVICVNDGSKDNSHEIIEKYQLKDSRIKLIDQINIGVSATRNHALKYATGTYIFYLDSDDIVHPQMLEICVEAAEKNQADVIAFDFMEFKKSQINFQNIKPSDIKISKVDLFDKMLTSAAPKITFSIWTKLYRKSILENITFAEDIKICEDILHSFTVASKKPKTYLINQKLYGYRVLGNSLSHGWSSVSQIQDYQKSIERILDLYNKDEERLGSLKKVFIPIILKHQIGRCRRVKGRLKYDMKKVFMEELKDLDAKGMLIREYHNKKRWSVIQNLLQGIFYQLSIGKYVIFQTIYNGKNPIYKLFGITIGKTK